MEDRGPAILAVTIALHAVATLFVFFRFVSRIFVVRRLGLHDYLMLLAWVCLLFYLSSKTTLT